MRLSASIIPHAGIAPRRGRAMVVLVAAVIGVALTVNLGCWQLRRAAQKVALQTALDTRAAMPALDTADLASDLSAAQTQHYRTVRLRGRWLVERTVFLENRQMNARVGFYVVTPLQLAGRSQAVLVQRGFVPRNLLDRTALPAVPTQAEAIDLIGRIAPPPARLFEFAASESGAIRQNIDLSTYSAETGLRLLPLSVQQTAPVANAPADGLLRQWPRPAVDVQMHYGYAFQWFALGALIAGLYVWFQLIRPRAESPA